MRNHLNDHCSGRLAGAIPMNFLQANNLGQCSVCALLVGARYNGVCPRCRPTARALNQGNAFASSPSQQAAADASLPSMEKIFPRKVPVWRHIPKQLRALWAQCLARSAASAAHSNGDASWSELSMLAKCTLCAPTRGGKKHKNQRIAFTRSRLQRWLAGERSSLWNDIPTYHNNARQRAPTSKQSQHHRCIELCREGAQAKSCNALVSDPPLQQTPDVTQQLRSKHPLAARPVDLSALGPPSRGLVPDIDRDDVDKAIRSFHPHSGGGPSALRPIHLKEALQSPHTDEVLEHITAVTVLLAQGRAPQRLAEFLAGASLVALPKKDGSIRPVAVGEVLRRLVAKVLCAAYQDEARNYLWPLQIGVAQPLGCEVGLHTAQQWFHRNRDNKRAVFLKVDFENAFNTVDRQAFLTQCRHHFPGLAPWVEYCYSNPTRLMFGSAAISSETGVQQGDPLGPLLFAIALQPVLQEIAAIRTSTSEQGESGLSLKFSYLDDCCLAGDYEVVASAMRLLQQRAASVGLTLKSDKCELIPAAGSESEVDRESFPSDLPVNFSKNFELLGGAIGDAAFCRDHTSKRVNKACKLLAAIGELPDPHVAQILLRHCAGFGKLVFAARVNDPLSHRDALDEFDTAVQACFESFSSWQLGEDFWTQATLGTKDGGLGFRRISHHSSAAYISSRSKCRELCQQLDPSHEWEGNDTSSALHEAVRDFNGRVDSADSISHDTPDPLNQQVLSRAVDKRSAAALRDPARADLARRAHLVLASAPGAGQWVHATPSKVGDHRVDPYLYRVMLARRVRAPIFKEEHFCPHCDGIVDIYGDHCLTCCGGGDRTKRHNLLRNAAFQFCTTAGLCAELERPGLLRPRPFQGGLEENGVRSETPRDPSARRPADVHVARWGGGLPAAWDFAVTSGLRSESLFESASAVDAATTQYEGFKSEHLETRSTCLAEGVKFCPMVIEASGGSWGPEARVVWSELAKHIASATGESDSSATMRVLQTLGLILHRENARAILRRGPAPPEFHASRGA